MVPTPQLIWRSNGEPFDAAEKVAFLQSWSFFGLLYEISRLCDLDINIEKAFLEEDGFIVSTTNINGLPKRWFDSVRETKGLGDKGFMEKIIYTARQAALTLTAEREAYTPRKTYKYSYTQSQSRVYQSLDIAVRAVGLFLLTYQYHSSGFSAEESEGWAQMRVVKSLNRHPDFEKVIRGEIESLSDLADEVRDELLRHGWCPSDTFLLDDEEVLYASLFERRALRDHSECNDSLCVAYQTDEATYRTRHVGDECKCDFHAIPTEALVDCLKKGIIPKIMVTEDLEVKVVAEDHLSYIALSHVCK